jgi:hypothetical protein
MIDAPEKLLNMSSETNISPHIDLSWIGHLISWLLGGLFYIAIFIVIIAVIAIIAAIWVAKSGSKNSIVADIVYVPLAWIAKKLSNRKEIKEDENGEKLAYNKDFIFTEVTEGTVKAVMRGNQFSHFLIAWTGKSICNKPGEYDVLNESGEIERKNLELGDVYNDPHPAAHPLGGYRFFGLPFLHNIYQYKFKWRGVGEGGKPQEERRKFIDYILLKRDVYYVVIEGAITGKKKELVPVDVGCLVTATVVNPHKALFRGQNWLQSLITLIGPQGNNLISLENYETLTSGRIRFEERMMKRLWHEPYVPDINEQGGQNNCSDQGEGGEPCPVAGAEKYTFVEYMEEIWGVQIEDFRILQTSISKGLDKDTPQYAAAEKFINEMKQRGEIAAENGRAIQVGIKAAAEVGRIEKVTGAWEDAGDVGTLLMILEALKASPVAYEFSSHSIPQLNPLLDKMGFKLGKEGTITQDDINNILGVIQGGKQTQTTDEKEKVRVKEKEKEKKSKPKGKGLDKTKEKA